VDAEAKANVTDPDSRIMKTRHGFIQGYNAQAVVTQDQIIVAAEVTQDRGDVHQLHPMLSQAQANLRQAGVEEPIGQVTADAGYWSEENAEKASQGGPELFVATTRDWKLRQAMKEAPSTQDVMAEGLSLREQMQQKLLTERGREVYSTRGRTVEPVFGQIKEVRGCDRFLRRGLGACDGEWKLICLTHNLLKLWRWLTEQLSSSWARGLRVVTA